MGSGDPIADDLAASFQRGAAKVCGAMKTAATTIATLKFKPSDMAVSSPFGPQLAKTGRGHRSIEASTSPPPPFEPREIELVQSETNSRGQLSREEKRRRKRRRKATKKSKRKNRR